MEVVKPSLESNSFKGASGTEYIIYPSLSTRRYQEFERLQIEIEYGTTAVGFRGELEKAYADFNAMRFADGSTKLNNALNGVDRIKNRQPHPVLLICSLFICTKDENQGEWSEAEAAEKIADWGNIDIAFFLKCARRFLAVFTAGYNSAFLDSLEEMEGANSEGGNK